VNNSNNKNKSKEEMLEKLRTEVLTCVKHGFFEISIVGELIKEGKRKVIIKSGKSHQFIF